MSNLLSKAIVCVVAVVGPAACAAEEKPAPDPHQATVRANLDKQAVAILPFEPTNSACAADPSGMDRATFAACAHLDPAKLPDDLEVTKDPLRFEPRLHANTILVVNGLPADPKHPEVTWHAIVGIGPVPTPAADSTLISKNAGGGLRPQAVPLLGAAAAVMFPVETAALLAAAETTLMVFVTGAAVLVGADALTRNQQEELVETDAQILMRSCLDGIPTGHTPKKEADEYWKRCPNGTGAK